MTKKYLVLIFILLLVGLFTILSLYSPTETLKNSIEIQNSNTSEFKDLTTINFNSQSYKAAWFTTTNISNISLIPNYVEKKTSQEVFQDQKCQSMTNAGFYTTEDTPIGLFISQENKLKNLSPNIFHNGVFLVTQDNTMSLQSVNTYTEGENIKLALQSGPLLIKDTYPQNISVSNDKHSRRTILAISQSNELYFLTFFQENSNFLGPLLEDMPEILSLFENQDHVSFSDAVNLDGGTASAFYTTNFKLNEITHSGSFFCVK